LYNFKGGSGLWLASDSIAPGDVGAREEVQFAGLNAGHYKRVQAAYDELMALLATDFLT
jgi:hypothetical protein